MTGAYDWLNTSPEDFLAQHLPAAAQRAGAQRATQVTKSIADGTFDPPNRPLQAPVAQIHQPRLNTGRQRNALHNRSIAPDEPGSGDPIRKSPADDRSRGHNAHLSRRLGPLADPKPGQVTPTEQN